MPIYSNTSSPANNSQFLDRHAIFGMIALMLLSATVLTNCEFADRIPPKVNITSPETGSRVSDTTTITCTSIDNEQVDRVELWIDESFSGISDDTDPYTLEWNTTGYADGEYLIFVRSYDDSGNSRDSDEIVLIVDNECDPGFVEIDSSCYWEADLQFLQILIDSSELGLNPLELGDQRWVGGRLNYLECNNCSLTGGIPTEIGELTSLKRLFLEDNQLSGDIPAVIGNLSNLRQLSLSQNQLSGAIPSEIGNLTLLEVLSLRNNQLSGEIPADGYLLELLELDLQDNLLSGAIPPELGDLPKLEELYLDSNLLSGAIPAALGGLYHLKAFSCSQNNLEGNIPPELGNLSNLEGLSLRYNQLSGSIPPELGDLSNLVYLRLEHNQLSGLIPAEICELQINWSSSDFSVAANQLCAPYPDCIVEYIGNQDTSGCD